VNLNRFASSGSDRSSVVAYWIRLRFGFLGKSTTIVGV